MSFMTLLFVSAATLSPTTHPTPPPSAERSADGFAKQTYDDILTAIKAIPSAAPGRRAELIEQFERAFQSGRPVVMLQAADDLAELWYADIRASNIDGKKEALNKLATFCIEADRVRGVVQPSERVDQEVIRKGLGHKVREYAIRALAAVEVLDALPARTPPPLGSDPIIVPCPPIMFSPAAVCPSNPSGRRCRLIR